MAVSSNKTIFITGGASGIGRAVAQRFAREGWFVGLADVNEPGMAETAAMLPAGRSSQHKLDVRERIAWDTALADCANAAGGRIDVVFNNAGIMPIGDLVSFYANVVRTGRTSITVDVEVYARRRTLHEVVKVTEATLTYVAVDDERRPRPLDRGST